MLFSADIQSTWVVYCKTYDGGGGSMFQATYLHTLFLLTFLHFVFACIEYVCNFSKIHLVQANFLGFPELPVTLNIS